MSTRSAGRARDASWPGASPLARDPAEAVAAVAAAKREVLLRVHRHRLRREDLEDAYAQASLELVVLARRGRPFASRTHIANSAANYLRAAGAPASYPSAIFAYNHSSSYVASVLRWAARYRDSATAGSAETAERGGWAEMVQARTATPVAMVEGSVARLAPGDGHVALIPEQAPPVVQAMLIAGNELQSLPYGPDGHPDPRRAPDEDCSSTINYVLLRAGARPVGEILRDNPLAQDYLGWGRPGRGRWVTIYAADIPTPHVFAVIAGLRLDTSHAGTDVGPNRDQDGPRWRILDHIPTWAHWSVRHPPGL